MIVNYDKDRDSALDLYENLKGSISEAGADANEDINSCLKHAEKLADDIRNNRFCMLVAGEAKSGKSTFINAYLRTNILPMDVFQCTNALIEISYAPEFTLEAEFADGTLKKVKGKENIKDFLKKNASVDEKYREIPVTLIHEYILEYKNKKIPNADIKSLLEKAKTANIYSIPEEDYCKRIMDYLAEKQKDWRNIVTRIVINYPFDDENMRDIKIIDSPGVNAKGRIGEVTDNYIQNANSIIFLKPAVGAAIVADGFKDFLEKACVNRNKEAIFLLLTNTASTTGNAISKVLQGAKAIYGNSKNHEGIPQDQIFAIDSKAEMYYNKYANMSMNDINADIADLNQKDDLDPFLFKAIMNGKENKDIFLRSLAEISNFEAIRDSLNHFGMKAKFILLRDLISDMSLVIKKLSASVTMKVDGLKLKAQDPKQFAARLKEIEIELANITNTMYDELASISEKYTQGKDNEIQTRAEEVIRNFRDEINALDPKADSSVDKLTTIMFRYIDVYTDYQEQLKADLLSECNERLRTTISNESIPFDALVPTITPDEFAGIKKKMRDESLDTFSTGFCGHDIEYRLNNSKFFGLLKSQVETVLSKVATDVQASLQAYVVEVTSLYSDKLDKNVADLSKEQHDVQEKYNDAVEIQEELDRLNAILDELSRIASEGDRLKGGIDAYAG